MLHTTLYVINNSVQAIMYPSEERAGVRLALFMREIMFLNCTGEYNDRCEPNGTGPDIFRFNPGSIIIQRKSIESRILTVQ